MRSASLSDAALPARVNILIAGAGVMGAAAAFWLTARDPSLRVLLVEREPGFARASSSLSASSIRQQFTTPVNIALSAFGIQFLRNADRALALEGTAPGTLSLGLTEPGYLYLAAPEHESVLRTANAIQRAAGADVALLSPADLGERFPWLSTDGIALGSLGLSGEGWFDGPALHQALLARARAQGARLIADTVCGINLSDRARSGTKRVTRVQLASGAHIQCDHFVNERCRPLVADARRAGRYRAPGGGQTSYSLCAVVSVAIASLPAADRPVRILAAPGGSVSDHR